MAAHSPALRYEAQPNYLWVLVALGLVAFAGASGYGLAVGELDAFYVTFTLAACIGVLLDFRIGVVMLIVLLPASATTLFPRSLLGVTGLNPNNLLLAATLVSFLARGRLQKPAGPFLPQALVWLLMVPVAIAGLVGMGHFDDIADFFFEEGGVGYTDAAGYFRDMVVKPLLIPVAALLIGAAVARSEKPERFVVPIALSALIVALLQIGFVVVSGARLGELAASSARGFFDAMGMHANDLGRLYAVAIALLAFVWWDTRRPGLKLFLFVTLNVIGFALVLTFSRAAFLGFLVVAAVFVVWKFSAKTLALGVLGALAALIVAPGYLVGRITVGWDSGDMGEVSAGRTDTIWEPLLPWAADAPAWGHGLGSIMWATPMHTGAMLPVTHAHNAYLEALIDMGVLGLAALLLYYVHVWRNMRALAADSRLSVETRALLQGGAAGLVCFAVTGMAGSSLRPDAEFAFLWMAIGLMYGILARKPAS
jgi:O-antigen ligase